MILHVSRLKAVKIIHMLEITWGNIFIFILKLTQKYCLVVESNFQS